MVPTTPYECHRNTWGPVIYMLSERYTYTSVCKYIYICIHTVGIYIYVYMYRRKTLLVRLFTPLEAKSSVCKFDGPPRQEPFHLPAILPTLCHFVVQIRATALLPRGGCEKRTWEWEGFVGPV